MRREIANAVKVLELGGTIIYPTETIYGIGVDPYSKKAVNKLFKIKERDNDKPISVAVSSIDMIEEVAYLDKTAKKFIDIFLPGPITVILPSKGVLAEGLNVKNGTIGIRMPDHSIALSLINMFGRPITSTSANISGKPAPKSPKEIKIKCDYFLDGGVLPGLPSTIVDIGKRIILRKGSLSREIYDYLNSI